MDTNLYCRLRGNYAKRRKLLAEFDRKFLEAAILDAEYNDFLRSRADHSDGDADPHGHGKRIPYIGWFWRHLKFSEGTLPIGNCGDFIGFIANNKWDHSERPTTPEEFAKIMEFIDAAMHEDQQGGELGEINRRTNSHIDALWDYLQTLEV